ncbi:MAG: hypothetical protein KIT84_15305 [Labilithrix sp.]|nr:hypothetical protein [Labilithrix sp.]MCW5812392.1 hypothetical protein [Labilithrix sp.]
MLPRVVGGCASLFLIACRPSEAPPPPEPDDAVTAPEPEPEPKAVEPAPKRVVVVTIDGVRWEDVLGATPETSTLAMPNLHRLVKERGAAFGGADCPYEVRTHGSVNVSLPGYLEIFTGKPTACTHNYCPGPDVDTFVDEAQKSSARAGDVAVFASWDRYGYASARDRKGVVMSAGARTTTLSFAKEDAKIKSLLAFGAAHAGYPGWGDYRQDVHTARIALRYLETKTPRLLVVGLGDADEQAHRGDVAGYKRAIARSDDFLGDLERTLARMGPEGERTAVLVTTDHGRARSLFRHGASQPESGRVFVAAWGAGIASQGVACAPEDLELTHVAGAVRALLEIESAEPAGPLAEALGLPSASRTALLTSDPASRSVR